MGRTIVMVSIDYNELSMTLKIHYNKLGLSTSRRFLYKS
jgi:hypothetical protein